MHAVTSAVSDSVQPYGLQPTRLLCPCGFSRQEYWSALPCPSPGDLPHPGIELVSHSPALAGGFFTTSTTGSRITIVFLRPALCSQSLNHVQLFATPPGSSVYGISQARIVEWVAISFSRRSSRSRDQTRVSCTSRWILYQVPGEAPRLRYHLLIFRINWSLKTKPQQKNQLAKYEPRSSHSFMRFMH